MKPLSVMVIAGEASGDLLAAELVGALRELTLAQTHDQSSDVQPLRTALAPRFFGAGGSQMAAAGVELACEMTKHSVIGISDVAGKLGIFFRRIMQLRRLAIERQPDVIILVDFSVFNHLLARVLRRHLAGLDSLFNNWSPKIVKYVSPQVWASRPWRAYRMPADFDLLLSIFPFEKAWYAQRVPEMRVEFVGNPLIGRLEYPQRVAHSAESHPPQIVLLPGSRKDEVRRHLPVVLGAFELIRQSLPGVRGKLVLPNEVLRRAANTKTLPPGLEVQVGGLTDALAQADLAITKSGTITMECAAFGVPAVVFYKTSWPTYHIGKQLVNVKYLAMPNLLAGEAVYPEFIQHEASAENIARAGLELLRDETRRRTVKAQLDLVIQSLGGPGAAHRAARAILGLLP